MKEWFYQMGNPLKIKNLLTYLLIYLLTKRHPILPNYWPLKRTTSIKDIDSSIGYD